MKTKKNYYIDLVFLIIILIIMYSGFIKPMISQEKVNEIENRNNNLLPKFSLKQFFSKKIQDEYELAYADQIPFSSDMKLFSKNISFGTKIKYIKMVDKNVYKKLGDYYLVDDFIVSSYKSKDSIKDQLDTLANVINKMQEANKNKKFYVYYVEGNRDINLVNNEKSQSYDYLKTILNDGIKSSVFRINSVDELKKNYYVTDHHWNYIGSYAGYKDIINMVFSDQEKAIEPNSTLSFDSIFDGSKARDLGGVLYFNEKFNAYDFTLKDHDMYINNEKVDFITDNKGLIEKNPTFISYAKWYGRDYGLIEYDYKNPSKENLLIIGDSFDNAINELIASHFNKTYNVDLRHYEDAFSEEFKINKFIKEKNIDKVLFVTRWTVPYLDALVKGID